jgi:hypothetical protein
MPADLIETLLKFEETIEPQLVAALNTAGAGNVFAAHSVSEISTPCLSVKLLVGATNGHLFKDPVTGFWMWDQWAVQVVGEVRTNRYANADSHATYRAKMRLVMLDFKRKINPLLNYHALADLPREDGTSNFVDEENNHDLSQITFSAVLAIKRDAWPTE